MDNREIKGLLRAMADMARLRILQRLASGGETTVSTLTSDLRISQPLGSWHLRSLRRAGLIATRRVGREVHCTLDRRRLRDLALVLEDLIGTPGTSRAEVVAASDVPAGDSEAV